MKTRKQVLAELEADKNVIEKYFNEKVGLNVSVEDEGDSVRFRIGGTFFSGTFFGVKIPYRPDIEPPPFGVGVYDRYGNSHVSKGRIDNDGDLQCTDGMCLDRWRSMIDPSHHSEGWNENRLSEHLRNK